MERSDPLARLYAAPPTWASERLVFRPFDDEDAPAVFDYASMPDIDAFVRWDAHATVADSLHYIRYIAVDRVARHLALAITRNGRVIGSFGVTADNVRDGEVSLGYVIHPEHAGQGYATEALRSWTRWVLRLPGVHTVKAFIQEGNAASRRVAEKAGFRDVRAAEDDEVPAACIGARTYVFASP